MTLMTSKGRTWWVKIQVDLLNNACTVWSRMTKFGRITRGRRISRGSASPHCKGAGPQHSIILGVPFYLCVHPLMQNYQIWRNTHGYGACFQVVKPHPHPKGAGPALQFWGFTSIYAYTLCCRTTKFDTVTHGRGLAFGGHPPLPKGAEPQSYPFFDSPLSIMTTLFNEERPNCVW